MELVATLEGRVTRPRVALTFDDGPGDDTPAILEALAARGARATFFLVGVSIPGRETIVRDMVAGSHELGNHTMTHARPLTELPPVELEHEIRAASHAIAAAAGVEPRLFRPPWLCSDDAVLAAARRAGLQTAVGASVIVPDWTIDSASAISELLVPRIRAGSIAVLHDGIVGESSRPTCRASADAVPLILDALSDYEFVTVSELMVSVPP